MIIGALQTVYTQVVVRTSVLVFIFFTTHDGMGSLRAPHGPFFHLVLPNLHPFYDVLYFADLDATKAEVARQLDSAGRHMCDKTAEAAGLLADYQKGMQMMQGVRTQNRALYNQVPARFPNRQNKKCLKILCQLQEEHERILEGLVLCEIVYYIDIKFSLDNRFRCSGSTNCFLTQRKSQENGMRVPSGNCSPRCMRRFARLMLCHWSLAAGGDCWLWLCKLEGVASPDARATLDLRNRLANEMLYLSITPVLGICFSSHTPRIGASNTIWTLRAVGVWESKCWMAIACWPGKGQAVDECKSM